MAVRLKPLFGNSENVCKWESSLDAFFVPGCYEVEIEHTKADVGLPIEFCGSQHYIVGSLIVTDSGTSTPWQHNRAIGQVLTFTNRSNKSTNVYVRTYADSKWDTWRSLIVSGIYDNITSSGELVSKVNDLIEKTLEIRAELTTEIQRAKNAERNIIGNPLTFEGYINTKGAISLNDSYKFSDYYLLSKNTNIVVKNGYAGTSSLLVAFYDKEREFISGISNTTEVNISFEDFPENAVYVRFSSKQPIDETLVSFTELSNVGILSKETELLASKNNAILKDISNIIIKRLQLTSYGYYNLAGAFNGTENAMNTGFVEFDHFTKLHYSVNMGISAASVCFFDSYKKCIPELSIPGTNSLVSGVLELDDSKYDNAKYFVVSYYDNKKVYADYEAVLYNDNSLEIRVSSVENIKKMLPPVDKGLKILIFGDSITTCSNITVNELQQTTAYELLGNSNSYIDEFGQTVKFSMWPFLMTKYLSCSDVRNYAISGASYTEEKRESGYERQNLSYQIQLALNDSANPNGVFSTDGEFVPDVVIFSLGTNDGTPNDTSESAMQKTVMSADGKSFDIEATLSNLDRTKTCEAIRYAFLMVKKEFPQSLCLCVLPIQRASREKPGINDELEKLAKIYSIKVVDGYSELGIVRDLELNGGLGANLKDGLHPNDKGQKLYTRMMVNAIRNNFVYIK